jgi:NADPH2:quinone reductase
MGHTVIGTSRDSAKSEKLREIGAHLVVDPDDPDWRNKVKTHLVGRRVDLAVDNIGGPLFNQVLDSLADRGRVSCVGQLAGPVPDFKPASLFFRRIRLGGIHVGAYTPEESRAAWRRVLGLLQRTGARPLVDSVWNFPQLKDAFARLNKGPMGKVLLRIE